MQNSGTSTTHDNRTGALFVWLLIVFCVGLAAGALLLKRFDNYHVDELAFLHQNLIISGAVDIFSSFRASIVFPVATLFLLYISGFSALMHPLELLLVFYRGFGAGFAIGYYYTVFALRGGLIVLFLVVPIAVFTALIIIVCAYQSFAMSSKMGAYLLNYHDQNSCGLKKYTLRFFCSVVAVALIGLVQSVLIYSIKGIL